MQLYNCACIKMEHINSHDKIEQNKIEQNKIEQDKIEQDKIKQDSTQSKITIMDIINSSDEVNQAKLIKHVMNAQSTSWKKYGKDLDPNIAQIGKRKRYSMEHGNYGKAYERYVEDYFIENNLPYWMNVYINNNERYPITEFDFIIPGGVIEVKNVVYGEKTVAALYDLLQKMKKIIQLIPSNFKIFFIINPKIADIKYIQYVLDESTRYDYSRIKLITHPSQIVFAPYRFFISHRKHLDRLASLNNLSHNDDVKLLQNKTDVLVDVYNDLDTFILPEEKTRLEEYNLKITTAKETHEQNRFVIHFYKHILKKPITTNKIGDKYFIKKFELFYNFKTPFKFISCGLSKGKRIPLKHNPEFNIICTSCQCINVIKLNKLTKNSILFKIYIIISHQKYFHSI